MRIKEQETRLNFREHDDDGDDDDSVILFPRYISLILLYNKLDIILFGSI